MSLYQAQVAAGPLVLDGEALTGVIVNDEYEFVEDHATIDDITDWEVAGADYERLTATGRLELIGSAWVVFLDGTTSANLSDVTNRGGIVWVRPSGALVKFHADPGGPINPYEPSWPDGLFDYPIESIDAVLAALAARTVAGVAVDGGDYPAAAIADALAMYLDGSGSGVVTTVDYGVSEYDITDALFAGLPEGTTAAAFDQPDPDADGFYESDGSVFVRTGDLPAGHEAIISSQGAVTVDGLLTGVAGFLWSKPSVSTTWMIVGSGNLGGVIDYDALRTQLAVDADDGTPTRKDDPTGSELAYRSDGGTPVTTSLYFEWLAYHKAQADALYVALTDVGAAGGVAELDGSGLVPSSQLPSYVDDVIEAANFAALPGTGATGKIYVTLDTNIIYRWSGSAYVEISASLALGTTSSTAHRGDHGNTAYLHSQDTTTNPHNVTKGQVGLGNVSNDAQLKAADLDTDPTFAANSDSKIPSQKAVKTAVDAKAPLASPGLTDTPTAPTATAGTNTTQIATTAFVAGQTHPAIAPSALAGTVNFALPWVSITAVNNTRAISVNTLWYVMFMVHRPITVDRMWCDVTTAVALSNLRMGIVAADSAWQPTGSALVDTESISAATTGGKTATVSVSLTPGRYLAVIGADTNGISVRAGQMVPLWGTDFSAGALGGTASIIRGVVNRSSWTYGSLGTPPAWNTVVASSFGPAADWPLILLRWS